VIIAHNARFDYGFLRAEFDRVEIDFQPRLLCSLMLSRRLYPELEDVITALPRLGVPMVMFQPQRGAKGPDGTRAARLYSDSYAQHLVQKLRKAADLPAHFTLDACRHGGMTELGDAELTEQEIMTLSTHATPDAARIYVKRSERQELTAALKRRDFVERKRTKQG
jgi:DNA polymerase III epsilon subunit-like protein